MFLYYFWDSIGLCCAGCCKKCCKCCKKCCKKNEKTSTVNLTGASSDKSGASSYKSVPLDESLSF